MRAVAPPLLSFALVLLALCLAADGARADVWTYTDKDGTVHFTNVRPRGRGARQWRRVMRTEPETRGRPARPGADVVPAADRSPERFSRYDDWIRDAAALYRIPEALVRAVIKVESDYDPRVVSSAGARGLMQLMPAAADDMGVHQVHDPRENIYGGTRYLRILANKFEGDIVLTIAAYHSGAANVNKWNDVPPYPKVQRYVRMVLRRYHEFLAAEPR